MTRLPLWSRQAPGTVAGTADHQPVLDLHLLPESMTPSASQSDPNALESNGLASKPRGAVVVLPGGGYQNLAPHEADPIAAWLNSIGLHAAVCWYRHAGTGHRNPVPMLDARRAIQTLRHRAAEWNIDPHRIAILGFSAGGHLAATTSTEPEPASPIVTNAIAHTGSDAIDQVSARPDLAILLYPVITWTDPFAHAGSRSNLLGKDADARLLHDMSAEHRVTSNTPPTFIYHPVGDATVPIENALLYVNALRRAGVSFELHAIAGGRHGMGMAASDPSHGQWPAMCAQWLASCGWR